MARYSNIFGAFEIDSMPGQSQVAVCHSFVVPEENRGKGYGHTLKAYQDAEIGIQHYDFAICTVASQNARQKRILTVAGWRHLTSFRNRRTCETTELWGREETVTKDKSHE